MDTLVIGLDAATWREIHPLMDAGELPTLGSLVNRGVSGRLRSTTPPMTPLAWTSMATGVNPGKHGIFDFFRLDPSTYNLETTDFGDMDWPAVWDVFETEDVRAGIFNFPVAFPPSNAGEFFVSGIPFEVGQGIARPSDVQERLLESGFDTQPEVTPEQGLERYYRAVRDQTSTQAAVLQDLLDDIDLDHLWAVFMGLDWAQHYLWETEIEGENAVSSLYRQVDSILGDLIEVAGDDVTVLVVSDHGARKIDGELHLNSVLERGGYLTHASETEGLFAWVRRHSIDLGWSLGRSLPRIIRRSVKWALPDKTMGEIEAVVGVEHDKVTNEIHWPATDAFGYGYMGRVYVHLQDVYPEGTVTSEDYDQLRTELASELADLSHPETGAPIVGSVIRPEEIYEGPHASDGGDLIVIPTDWRYMTYGDFGDDWIHAPKRRIADHEPDGVLIAAGPELEAGTVDADVTDIAPTLLALHDLPLIEGMDGTIVTEIAGVTDTDRRAPASRYRPATVERRRTESEEREVRDRLEDLGYL